MAAIWLPSDDRHTLALREPNLLVPGKKPVGPVEIDWSHQLAQGLSNFILFNEENPRDLVTGSRATKYGNAFLDRGADGFSLDENGDYLTLPNVKLFDNHTIFTNINFTDNTGSMFQYFLSTGNFSAANSINIYLNESSSAARPNTLSYAVGTSGVYIDIPYWSTYNGVNMAFRKLAGVSHSVFYDGVNITGTLDSTLSAINGTPLTLYIGARADVDAGRMTGGVIKYLAIFGNKALSQAEIARFQRNPYQILKPANSTPYLISVPTGGATVTLSSPTATATGTTTATVGCTVTYT